MSDDEAESNSVSPVLKADWFNSRWGREDQRGNGNLMTRDKVLEATRLIKTGEIVSLGMPYDARMPIARTGLVASAKTEGYAARATEAHLDLLSSAT